MAAAAQDDETMITGINVTPLVDITLVLLIIFMVTATTIVRESIEIDLPRAANGGESVGVMLNVVLARDGKLYLDGAEIDEPALVQKVAAAVEKDRDARAIISADRTSAYGRVVRVIDLIKGGGVARFAINIERDAAE